MLQHQQQQQQQHQAQAAAMMQNPRMQMKQQNCLVQLHQFADVLSYASVSTKPLLSNGKY